MNVRFAVIYAVDDTQLMQLQDNFDRLSDTEKMWLGALIGKSDQHYAQMAQRMRRKRSILVIAESNNQIVGSMHAILYPQKKLKHKAKLRRLIVNKEYRGLGIATQLFMTIEEEIYKRGKTHIHFGYHRDNPAAALYHKLGYHTPEHYVVGRKVWIRVEKRLN